MKRKKSKLASPKVRKFARELGTNIIEIQGSQRSGRISEEDRLSLVEALNRKTIDVIVSDHKPEDEEQKRLTFSRAATGSSGVETLLPLSLELFHNGSVKLNTLIEALTCNPAKILKIDKGNLNIGNDADFCIVDIHKPWIVKSENMISKSKNSSIENKKLQGKVLNTFVNGEELYKI